MVTLRTDVLIVGAGFAGVGMARSLMASAECSFMVVERADRIGGTWRDNTYPGVACDVPADLYRFRELPYQGFSKMLPPGAEIRAYLESAAEPIRPYLHLNTELQHASWDETHGEWSVRTSSGPVVARALVLACGRLAQPRRIPEVDAFEGPVMHTAEWDHTTDLSDADVALVGVGASGVQVLPHLAARTRSTVVFQRSAPWILARDDSPYRRVDRRTLLSNMEHAFKERAGDKSMRRAARDRAKQHLATQVGDLRLRRALQPDYEFGCKRVLFSNNFYPTLLRHNVHLEPHAVTGSGPTTIESAAGRRFGVDAIILATGFDTAEPAYSRIIVGRHAQSLAAAWRNGMSAFASVTVHGFPNMFILGGPNSALSYGSAVLMLEAQIGYTVGAIQQLQNSGTVEVRADAQRRYTNEIGSRSKSAPWTSGCSSWYLDPRNGRQILLWPGSVVEYTRRFGNFSDVPYSRSELWTILVPLKPADFAKSRLHLPERAQLARAFAIDTIRAIAAADNVGEVVVITADKSLLSNLPRNARGIVEDQPCGINKAIDIGLQKVDVSTPRAAIVGDLPTLTSDELSQALSLARKHTRGVVADAENLGTTLVSATAGTPLVTHFGRNSLARHINAGFTTLEIPNSSGLRRDFDTVDHVREAHVSRLGTRTRSVLAATNDDALAQRL
ncbi:MAG: 2-phospho-L-lactate guanylyltransferase [Mycobacterium sp.]